MCLLLLDKAAATPCLEKSPPHENAEHFNEQNHNEIEWSSLKTGNNKFREEPNREPVNRKKEREENADAVILLRDCGLVEGPGWKGQAPRRAGASRAANRQLLAWEAWEVIVPPATACPGGLSGVRCTLVSAGEWTAQKCSFYVEVLKKATRPPGCRCKVMRARKFKYVGGE